VERVVPNALSGAKGNFITANKFAQVGHASGTMRAAGSNSALGTTRSTNWREEGR